MVMFYDWTTGEYVSRQMLVYEWRKLCKAGKCEAETAQEYICNCLEQNLVRVTPVERISSLNWLVREDLDDEIYRRADETGRTVGRIWGMSMYDVVEEYGLHRDWLMWAK